MLPELSALGWFHALGSLPALPVGLMLLVRQGRIDPSSGWGKIYLLFMFLGAVTGVLVIRDAPGVAISILSLSSLVIGSTVRFVGFLGGHRRWIETVAMSTSFFTLLLPSITETLTRLPVGAPIAASPQVPLMQAIHLALLAGLVVGVTLQLLALRRVRPVAVA